MRNRETDALAEPRIDVLTQLQAFRGTDPKPDSTAPKGKETLYTWTLPTLPTKDQLGVWLGKDSSEAFVPGFDSRRTTIPTIFDGELTNQTVVVTVVPRENLTRIEVDVRLEKSIAGSASFVLPSAHPKEDWVSSDNKDVGWGVDNPEPNREYEFNITILVRNPSFPEKMFLKPRVTVAAIKAPPEQSGHEGSSVPAKDEMLGSLTFSATGRHEWQYYHDNRLEVVHATSSGAPLVTLTIDSPAAFWVVRGVVHVTAFAFSSTGTIDAMDCRVDKGEWVPMELRNTTQQQWLLRPMASREGRIDLDTSKLSNGPHDISIKTEDSNGISENKTITVIVHNSEPRFVGYSQLINFAYVCAVVIGVVGLASIRNRRSRR